MVRIIEFLVCITIVLNRIHFTAINVYYFIFNDEENNDFVGMWNVCLLQLHWPGERVYRAIVLCVYMRDCAWTVGSVAQWRRGLYQRVVILIEHFRRPKKLRRKTRFFSRTTMGRGSEKSWHREPCCHGCREQQRKRYYLTRFSGKKL